MLTILPIQKILRKHKNVKQAQLLSRFFKTGPGGYAEGDKFLGIMVPTTRSVAKSHKDLSFIEIIKLLHSEFHEERLLALCIMVYQFQRGDDAAKTKIYNEYLRAISKYINNWDLVDLSCSQIVGAYLQNKPRKILYQLARSKNLWERRVAIISTAAFIRQNQFADTVKLSELLINDNHDLIHKATGWMLREVGKRDITTLRGFLNKHARVMPRTMLRYSIEKLSPSERLKYLNAKNQK